MNHTNSDETPADEAALADGIFETLTQILNEHERRQKWLTVGQHADLLQIGEDKVRLTVNQKRWPTSKTRARLGSLLSTSRR